MLCKVRCIKKEIWISLTKRVDGSSRYQDHICCTSFFCFNSRIVFFGFHKTFPIISSNLNGFIR